MRRSDLRAGLVAAIVCVAACCAVAQEVPSNGATATTAPAAQPAAPGPTVTPTAPAPGSVSATRGSAVGETLRNPNLPHELSPLAMFQQADWIVKGVMIGLAFASVVSWTVWLFKTIELYSGRARLKRDLDAIMHEASLGAATERLAGRRGVLPAFIDAATLELRMSRDAPDRSGIKERVASRLERLESAAVRGMNRGLGVVASIGSTAPFVGLFGTVWGIMNSFIGISKAQTTNLAVVAPGIAEALLATAMGLAAAIPAVIIYNWFSRGLGVYRARAGDAAAEVMRLVSRDLDRVDVPRRSMAAE